MQEHFLSQYFQDPHTFQVNSEEDYRRIYAYSIDYNEDFWGYFARQYLDWEINFQTVKTVSWAKETVLVKWFEDGKINASYNCLDRHLATKSDQVAFYFEPDDPHGERSSVTYEELYIRVCVFANVLKKRGIVKGDVVSLFMPMTVEAVVAMLACARIGALHSVVFAGFSGESLANRLIDASCRLVITADYVYRAGERLPLKDHVDKARSFVEWDVEAIVLDHTQGEIQWNKLLDFSWYDEIASIEDKHCNVASLSAEDGLFLLYTSGSTGTPKGVLHTIGGYLLYVAATFQIVLDYKEGDVYWCTADVGWITGHSYLVYGPLCQGATSVLYEGVPYYPDSSRIWEICDLYRVSILYTAPTLLRYLMQKGDSYVKKTQRTFLRVLGSVGEPINPEAWKWYFEVVGDSQACVVDTWWQTETGGHLISPLVYLEKVKPGMAMRPFFGIVPVLLNDQGEEIKGEGSGLLCIKHSWPGQMRMIYNDKERFYESYFGVHEGYYFTGDGALRDHEGDYRITGRVDDILNVSGHRLSTAEIEAVLTEYGDVVEVAIVGRKDAIKGENIYAFIVLRETKKEDVDLKQLLNEYVKSRLGPLAGLSQIQFCLSLPKTRSGKIMRRILRKIASLEEEDFGDLSTLSDSQVVENLMKDARLLGQEGVK